MDATRVEYEREHGAVPNPGALLQLVVNDPAFSWLRPLSELMSRVDALAEAEPLDAREALLLRAALDSWAQNSRYLQKLQARPDLVLAHAQLHFAIRALEEATALGRPLFAPTKRVEVGIA